MGLMEEARAQMRQGQADANRVLAGHSVSTSTVMKAGLSIYWLAGLLAVLLSAVLWRATSLAPWQVLCIGLVAGLVLAWFLTRALQAFRSGQRAR